MLCLCVYTSMKECWKPKNNSCLSTPFWARCLNALSNTFFFDCSKQIKKMKWSWSESLMTNYWLCWRHCNERGSLSFSFKASILIKQSCTSVCIILLNITKLPYSRKQKTPTLTVIIVYPTFCFSKSLFMVTKGKDAHYSSTSAAAASSEQSPVYYCLVDTNKWLYLYKTHKHQNKQIYVIFILFPEGFV